MPLPPQPNTASSQKRTGTGFTNISQYKAANKPQQLGQVVSAGLTGLTEQAKTGAEQQIDAFGQQLDKTKEDIKGWKEASLKAIGQLSGKGQSDTTQIKAPSEQQLQATSNILQKKYTGPESLDLSQQQSQATKAAQLARLGSSEGGRQALLQQFVGGKGYSQGLQKLDTMLLGQQAGQATRDARRESSQLLQQLPAQQQALLGQADAVRSSLGGLKGEVEGQLGTALSDYDRMLQQQLDTEKAAYQTSEQNARKLAQAFDAGDISSAETQALIQQMGMTPEQASQLSRLSALQGKEVMDGDVWASGYAPYSIGGFMKQLSSSGQVRTKDEMNKLVRDYYNETLGKITGSGYDNIANIRVSPINYQQVGDIDMLAGLSNTQDVGQYSKVGTASQQQLAAINALRQLQGQTDLGYGESDLAQAGSSLGKRATFDPSALLGQEYFQNLLKGYNP